VSKLAKSGDSFLFDPLTFQNGLEYRHSNLSCFISDNMATF